jgi:hypothetical protein
MKALSVFRSAVFVVVGLAGHSAAAQTMAEADCTAIWEKAAAINASMTIKTFKSMAVSDGWCRFEDVVIGSDETYDPRFEMSALSFRGDGIAGLFDLSALPTSVEMKIESLVVSVNIDDPVMSYLLRTQTGSRGINAEMSVGWDASTKVLSLRQFDIDFPGENAISATAEIKGVDLDAMAQTNGADLALTAFEGSITSNGLFEGYALMPLGNLLLGPDEPPEAQVEALKAEATALIAGLPDTAFSSDSKAALAAVMAQMPNPAGKLDFSIKSEAGVGPARLMGLLMIEEPSSIDDLAPMFDGVTVEATFAPTPDE